jgi:HD-GYP domain-containing protein (c-di-GMP phosphodiesterase class II)
VIKEIKDLDERQTVALMQDDLTKNAHLVTHIHKLAQIGLALSVEKDIDILLSMILTEARALVHADAGTLYIVDKNGQRLKFAVLQNDTFSERSKASGGTIEATFPDVPLYENEVPNYQNVSSYAALTGEVVNISDVYAATDFDFTGPRRYDAATGYRTASMLVIPMQNHENDIIGVMQLLNAKNPRTGQVEGFSGERIGIIRSLASQAAVSLTNTQLINELKALLHAIVQSVSTAIDAKSPYTGGHIKRVVDLTMTIAQKINETDQGCFADTHFNADEMEELRLAAWMHDVGKITTPEYVVDKATKLQTIFDRIELIETRFHLIAKSIENLLLHQKILFLQGEGGGKEVLDRLEKKTSSEITALYAQLDQLKALNKGSKPMSEEDLALIQMLSQDSFHINGEPYPYLTDDEVKNLSIRQGTLTNEERAIIENHATMTLKILKQLPFPKRMSNTPEYAGAHHEKLDGTGYPLKLSGKNLPLQSKILAIADIFEALTAKDRPYKPPLKLSQALNILESMKKNHHIDPDIFDLFIRERLFAEYAQKEMFSSQIDEILNDNRG